MGRHRDAKLSEEIYFVVLRLLQLRNIYTKTHKGLKISSVKYQGKELGWNPKLATIELKDLEAKEAIRLGQSLGFMGSKRGRKTDITINDINFAVRCLNHTNRPLVNHSDRRKYESICLKLGLDITVLDEIIKEYWIRRKLGIFNEDCFYYSDLNPFLAHKDFLKELLTYMAFNSFNYDKSPDSSEFVVDSITQILDYVNPWDDSTWRVYSHDNYFESIWSSLCFSMRGDKGMPVLGKLLSPEYEDVMKWVNVMPGKKGVTQYKGALHIRVKKFDSAQKGQVFEDKYKEVIASVKQNQGERDEYLLKLFLIECRRKKLSVPIGDTTQIVKSVGGKNHEYGEPEYWLKWDELGAEDLIYVCNSVKANKAGKFAKADVFINGIGISVKSERGAAPSLINQTTRNGILRVMHSLNASILPLDKLIDEYWFLREKGIIGEDVRTHNSNSPFSDKNICMPILKPLLNYFAFDGTGSQDSVEPAELILSLKTPNDINTWVYYTKEDFIESVWEKLVISIRSKGTPQDIAENPNKYELLLPWIRKVENSYCGALNVRVAKSKGK